MKKILILIILFISLLQGQDFQIGLGYPGFHYFSDYDKLEPYSTPKQSSYFWGKGFSFDLFYIPAESNIFLKYHSVLALYTSFNKEANHYFVGSNSLIFDLQLNKHFFTGIGVGMNQYVFEDIFGPNIDQIAGEFNFGFNFSNNFYIELNYQKFLRNNQLKEISTVTFTINYIIWRKK